MNYNPTILIERDSAVGGWEITIDDVQVFFRDSVVADNFGAMLEHSEHILSLKAKGLTNQTNPQERD